ncbi:hypothetical protein COCC4DRAFT_38351 [Bipolaris maydis ATCC 48331]|uniref:Uncharacterized protein n=1 Tax=Cochliobolus heterostrophus (strain C4 / ATCC 48331 / race T) TaxID=665024 RepID=N4XMQ1_COCH4|nr:uncharacterized protein COCC4DRAFT_38351 [Bipolaris maydis ATCC 48331]ENI07616.1 hypothetical protein COCC4DRAFT_38351 [Bipolaris maydis ATCC 48331]
MSNPPCTFSDEEGKKGGHHGDPEIRYFKALLMTHALSGAISGRFPRLAAHDTLTGAISMQLALHGTDISGDAGMG